MNMNQARTLSFRKCGNNRQFVDINRVYISYFDMLPFGDSRRKLLKYFLKFLVVNRDIINSDRFKKYKKTVNTKLISWLLEDDRFYDDSTKFLKQLNQPVRTGMR